MRFPNDAPKERILRARERLGFRVVREGNHIPMIRENPDGTRTPLTLPDQRFIRAPTLRAICTQSAISRSDFLRAYKES